MYKRRDVDQHQKDGEDAKYKSPNLKAERRRRKKLSDRHHELRAIVPKITNMTKAAIITDAISYIEELQKSEKELIDQLMQMEATCSEEEKPKIEETNAAEEMNKWGIQPEVEVSQIDGTKLWIKIVCQKKKGGFTKLMEAMNVLGFDLTHTSVTTSKGAFLVTSCVEGIHGGIRDPDQIKEYLLGFIKSM